MIVFSLQWKFPYRKYGLYIEIGPCSVCPSACPSSYPSIHSQYQISFITRIIDRSTWNWTHLSTILGRYITCLIFHQCSKFQFMVILLHWEEQIYSQLCAWSWPSTMWAEPCTIYLRNQWDMYIYICSLCAHNWNLMAPISSLVCILMIQSGHQIAHAMTAQLSWHVHLMIWSDDYFLWNIRTYFCKFGVISS